MKLINILLVTSMLLMAADGGNPKIGLARMDHAGGSEVAPNIGLSIRLDFNPTSWSGSILFEGTSAPEGSDPVAGLRAADREEKHPSLARSLRDRYKAFRIIAGVAVRLMEKAVLTFAGSPPR
jgi:hypothetical protein